MSNLETYRNSEQEKARTADLPDIGRAQQAFPAEVN